MQTDDRPPGMTPARRKGGDGGELPTGAARLVHSQIVAAAADLERLLQLLDQAGGDLMARFAAFDRLAAGIAERAAGTAIADEAVVLRGELLGATTALQFQDMSTQLVNHALGELRTLAHRLGDDARIGGHDAPAVRRGPVSQAGIDAGSIDLF
jgi:hypothetical protein